MTCIVYSFTLFFSALNILQLYSRGRTDFTSGVYFRKNDASRVFTEDDGFQIAFALINDQNDFSDEELNQKVNIKV